MPTSAFEPARRQIWFGHVGSIELLLDSPEDAPRAMALIAHPHPLLGGGVKHKVPAILASSLCARGWLAVRPSFRGTGGSEGMHDHGVGETDDLVAVARRLRVLYPSLPLVLIGFSFGAYVQTRVARRLTESGEAVSRLVLVGAGIGEVAAGRRYDTGQVPPDTVVIHGELDDHVPLGNVLRWAEPQMLPVVVVPGADHFFSRRLTVLARLVCSYLEAIAAPVPGGVNGGSTCSLT